MQRKNTKSMAAYEYVLTGKVLHHRSAHEANAEALRMLERAIELDPNYAHAHAWKACVVGQAWLHGWCERSLGYIFRDGVNVAARLESVAEPGGIWRHRQGHKSFDRGHSYAPAIWRLSRTARSRQFDLQVFQAPVARARGPG